ncbi:MAG: dTMP kinase [Candidatus Peregrinibacteria bacterium Gr01-1014_25]|nr:MAG: dTMP kinase [Candidatus Peregrinibacteria bacterium Gr01-1014_25]
MVSDPATTGRFLVLDGPDGSGTTTHARLLHEALTREGRDCLLTAEPTDGPVGSGIRTMLREGAALSPADLQKLFVDDRAWHVREVVEPAIARGAVVVCDRYVPSTIAYGEALGLDRAWLEELNKNFVHPSALILLLPPLDVCMERLRRRPAQDAMEDRALQERVHAAYHRYAAAHPDVIVIENTGTKDETAATILAAVRRALN